MNIDQFRLGLEQIRPSEWEVFEELASSFLVPEFPQLRTMATASGEGGRDSELFQPEGTSFICCQYSIRKDWKQKINQTVERLAEKHPDIRILIYMTNLQIGGKADDLRGELLKKGLSLDIRGRDWFLERAAQEEVRKQAAEKLIDKITRPYLASEKVINKTSSPLSSGEARAALLFLGMQWQDDIAEKGLTKLSFDALVRAALRHSHSEKRMTRCEIHTAVQNSLPSSDKDRLIILVNAALKRLTKRYIRHWQMEDKFCLTHEEHQRILMHLAKKEVEESEFNEEITEHCKKFLAEIEKADEADLTDLQERIPRIIEKLLLRKGEAFVLSVMSSELNRFGFEHLNDIILNDLSAYRQKSNIIQHLPGIIAETIRITLTQPVASTQCYLRRLSDSYTLFSFLRETPDVQSATRKLFSYGKVWLDTTVLLHLFAEQAEEDINQRKFSKLFKTCTDAGIEFYVTPGVIQEIYAHMNVALACSRRRPIDWNGRVPYLYNNYLQAGRPSSDFANWLSLFRGEERPEDDVSQFLSEQFEINRKGLIEEMAMVDDELLYAAKRLWSEAHQERRSSGQSIEFNEDITNQLIDNDLETYLGVIGLRREEKVSELGYQHWLLTLDSIAWQIRNDLRGEFRAKTPSSPLLSLDFLINNLTFGPKRQKLSRSKEQTLPIVLDIEMSDSMPQDILQIAEKVREENEGLPEFVIRRKVRDELDRARRQRKTI